MLSTHAVHDELKEVLRSQLLAMRNTGDFALTLLLVQALQNLLSPALQAQSAFVQPAASQYTSSH